MLPRTHTKSGVGKGEVEIYRILTMLAPFHNDRFTVLQLPSAISIDAERGVLTLPHYQGQDLARHWDESDGGAALGINLASEVPRLLEDLAQIDTACVTTDPVLATLPGIAFDHAVGLARSTGILRRLLSAGLLSTDDCALSERLLADEQHTPMIISNGDFYPRNLIVQPTGRIVVVDWETFNPNSPFHTVDHPENVAAVFYVHMWANPAWQDAYRAALDRQFRFSARDFAKGVVIQAAELANMWMGDRGTAHLAAIQASIITGTLRQTPRGPG